MGVWQPGAPQMGVAAEGESPSDGAVQAEAPPARALPSFDNYRRQSHYIEVYNRGQTPFTYAITAGAPWLTVEPKQGTIDKEQRVRVAVDWPSAPLGVHVVPITILGPNDQRATIEARIENRAAPDRNTLTGFVEGDGYASIEAEHYTEAVDALPIRWLRIPDFGRTLSGMTSVPVNAPSNVPGTSSPRLEYRVVLFDSGAVDVKAYVAPSLNFTGSPTGLRYAISFDDDPPQIVNILADSSNRAWEQAVANDIRLSTTRHILAHAGPHVLKFWRVDAGVVLEKLVIDAGGLKPSYLGPPESFRRGRR